MGFDNIIMICIPGIVIGIGIRLLSKSICYFEKPSLDFIILNIFGIDAFDIFVHFFDLSLT